MEYNKGMEIVHKTLGKGIVIKTIGAKTIVATFPEQNNTKFYVLSKDVTVEEDQDGD